MDSNSSHTARGAGCIVGAFIGDALGLGPYWYDDLEEIIALARKVATLPNGTSHLNRELRQ